ncbi:hypothetical protein XPA_006771 [Xanthoria parietina]
MKTIFSIAALSLIALAHAQDPCTGAAAADPSCAALLASGTPSATVSSTATVSSIVGTTSVSLSTPYPTGASPGAGIRPTGTSMGGPSTGDDTGIVPFQGAASYVGVSSAGLIAALVVAVLAL